MFSTDKYMGLVTVCGVWDSVADLLLGTASMSVTQSLIPTRLDRHECSHASAGREDFDALRRVRNVRLAHDRVRPMRRAVLHKLHRDGGQRQRAVAHGDEDDGLLLRF